ncbi:MAG TPA: hypothetical protein VFI25_06415 [Planctomycetota bacterium]|jgi:hypothetical protein|nr:hypothetical protein [Planctomycetota bacterium]
MKGPPASFRGARAAACALVAALLVVGWPALRTGFLGDDFFVLARTWREGKPDLRPVLEDVTGPWQGREGIPYWRPLASAVYVPDTLLFPANAGASHALNLLVHALATLATALLARRLLPEGGACAPLLAAAVGAFGSTRAELLGWASCRLDLCTTALFLAACALALRSLREGLAPRIPLSLGLFGAALLCKEWGIVAPLVLLGLDLATPGSARPGARARLYGGLAATIGAYLGARLLALGSLAGGSAPLLRPGPIVKGLLRALSTAAFPFDPLTLGSAAGAGRLALFLLAVLAVAAAASTRAVPTRAVFGTLLAWIAVTLPAAPIAPGETLAGSRVLHVSGFFFALVLATACAPAVGRTAPRATRFAARAFLFAFVAVGAVSLRLALERWREAGDLGRRALEFIAPRVAENGPPAVVAAYPAGLPGVPIFLAGGVARTEGIAPALVGPFARNRRAPLALSTFLRHGDGAPHHALRAAGFRFVGFGYAGEEIDWTPPAPASPAALEVASGGASGGPRRTVLLRAGPIDARLYAGLSLTIRGAEGARVAAEIDWGRGPSNFVGRVRGGRLVLPIGSDLAWWIAGEVRGLRVALEGLPEEAVVSGATLLPELPELGLPEEAGSDPFAVAPPAADERPLRLVLLAPTFTRELFFDRPADEPPALDAWSRRQLREDARLLHGLRFAWFLEALEEPGDRRSAAARSRIRFVRLEG